MASRTASPNRLHPSKLNLYPGNARRGDVRAIEGSLRAHGQYKPITVNKGTHTGAPNEVLAGNHTVMAIRNLAEKYPDDERWQSVLVHWLDVDADTAKRIVLVDNRTSELGGMDADALYELVSSVSNDLAGTGYTDGDLTLLAEQINSADDLDGKSGTDPFSEWEGMPHYESNDENPCRKIIVSFETPEDVAKFAAVLGVEITDKAKSMWYPEKSSEKLTGLAWAEAQEGEGE